MADDREWKVSPPEPEEEEDSPLPEDERYYSDSAWAGAGPAFRISLGPGAQGEPV